MIMPPMPEHALCEYSPLDLYHRVAECNHGAIDAWARQLAVSDARSFVSSLTLIIAREQ